MIINARRARVLVVGGGASAAQGAAAAGAAGAAVRVVDPQLGEQVRTVAAQLPTVTVEPRAYAPEDMAWASLVFAAADDAALNTRVAELAQVAGRPVHVAGDPEASTFTTPEVLRAGGLTIAISADGVDPMARRVRDMLAEQIGPSYASAMDGLLALRERLLARGDATRWIDAVESLLDDDVCQSIERGTFARRLAAWQ